MNSGGYPSNGTRRAQNGAKVGFPTESLVLPKSFRGKREKQKNERTALAAQETKTTKMIWTTFTDGPIYSYSRCTIARGILATQACTSDMASVYALIPVSWQSGGEGSDLTRQAAHQEEPRCAHSMMKGQRYVE